MDFRPIWDLGASAGAPTSRRRKDRRGGLEFGREFPRRDLPNSRGFLRVPPHDTPAEPRHLLRAMLCAGVAPRRADSDGCFGIVPPARVAAPVGWPSAAFDAEQFFSARAP